MTQQQKPTDAQASSKTQTLDPFNAALYPQQFLDYTNRAAELYPALWKETFTVLAVAAEDYANLLRKLSKIDSPLDATALVGEYLQVATRTNLDNIAKLATHNQVTKA